VTFRPELLNELLKGDETPKNLLEDGGILKQLAVALVERCLNAAMKTHLEGLRTATQPFEMDYLLN
jgi:putative transposase